MTAEELTQQGIAALKSGDKARARELLLQAVEHDPQNQLALLWLAGTGKDLLEQKRYLEQVVAIDATSATGRRAATGLQHLSAKLQDAAAAAPPTRSPSPPPATSSTSSESPTMPGMAAMQPPQDEPPQADPAPPPAPEEPAPPLAQQQDAEPQPAIKSLSRSSLLPGSLPADTLPPPSPPPTTPPPTAATTEEGTADQSHSQLPPLPKGHAPPPEKERKIPVWVWVVGALALISLVPCVCIGGVGVLTLLGSQVSEVFSNVEGGGLVSSEPAPSIPISDLEPFTHEDTGISGLRPVNWEDFSDYDYFEVSSSAAAPDDFVAWVTPPEDFTNDDIVQTSEDFLASFKEDYGDVEPTEVLEETSFDDGSATLLVSYSETYWWGDEESIVRHTAYVRTAPVDEGLLVAYAYVPADLFALQENHIRSMVDSLTVE